jgi:hypothetical protein
MTPTVLGFAIILRNCNGLTLLYLSTCKGGDLFRVISAGKIDRYASQVRTLLHLKGKTRPLEPKQIPDVGWGGGELSPIKLLSFVLPLI